MSPVQSQPFDPAIPSAEISAATARLLDTIRSMADDDVLAPSLLPGWSRGHVLTHLARNADALTTLIQAAAEGVERPAYPDREKRNSDIDAGAGRPLKDQLADIEATHGRFAEAVAALPPERWGFVNSKAFTSRSLVASEILDSRLREVAIHHVDLDAGYTAADWAPEFALRLLRSVAPSFEGREIACVLRPSDADTSLTLNGEAGAEVRGPAHALLTWLIGRDSGAALTTSGGTLPAPPAWF